jgi:asparagine synthase (glutamine-hydrolysing)
LSAIVVIYERANTPVESGVLARVMNRLTHRGPDGSHTLCSSHAVMGHLHFWVTPEEVEEQQPLELGDLPFKIVLDGRLDNRSDLISKLNLNAAHGKLLSDAALMLRAYERWGADCVEHFIGEFALVIRDERRAELFCARDALGDRTLFYSFKGTRLVVASEAWAVAGADGLEAELNESALAHYFALQANEDGQTLFKNVYELLPAHTMLVNASGVHLKRYWQPDATVSLRGRSDQEYAEGFRALLEESVQCRLRSATPPAVLMSGGLDSTSVACLAARSIAPKTLTTLSYFFDELPDCDERRYIKTIQARYGIRSIQIPCDDLWPYKNLQDWPRNPNQPDGNAYRLVMERAYQLAAQSDLRVLLTGTYGDELYDGEEDWLADLIVDKRFREAGHELIRHLRYAGLLPTLKSGYLRRSARRLLNAVPGGKKLRGYRGNLPAWLTSYSASQLGNGADPRQPVHETRSSITSLETASDCTHEIIHASRHGLELRHPYRDRRLVEYVLSLPAHQLYNHGQYKHVLRTAMPGILPDAIRTRSRPTTLLSLMARGVEREKKVLQSHVQDPAAAWRKYVRVDWLMERWNIPVTLETDGIQTVIPWLCISFSGWHSSFIRDGVDDDKQYSSA